MTLPEILPITPFTAPASGKLALPGSKSLTNRALLLAALGREPVTLTEAGFSDDTRLMAAAIRALGGTVETDEDQQTFRVSHQHQLFRAPEPVDLFVGLSGTAARFLTAWCGAAPHGRYRLDGIEQMRHRPMAGLIQALRALGAKIHCPGEEGFLPLEIQARGLHGGAIELDAGASSQLLSALLMVAPLAREPVTMQLTGAVRWTFVEMTRQLMATFGGAVSAPINGRFEIVPRAYTPPSVYRIEPDATAASYWQALSFITRGHVDLTGLRPVGHGLQGDAAFAEVMTRAADRQSGVLLEEDFREISDTFLTFAAIAPLFNGPTRITGIAHTRHQETDRVAGMAAELRRLGQAVIEEEDALTITPRPLITDQIVETHGDHRFAMSFGILGCHDPKGDGQPWLSIHHPNVCTKTFPRFFELLETVRTKSCAP